MVFPTDSEDPAHAPLRILVGDPDVTTTDLLSRILRGRGYEVETVRTEAAVLERVDNATFDVVLLAWSLPGTTGLEVLRQVRARFAMPDLPVVLMSSHAESVQVVRAFDRGANEFLNKPLDPDVTLVRVHNLVALRRARLALHQLAMVDSLTGVFNRRYMMEQLRRQLAQAQRYGRELSFCLCDIDRFKTVNDTHGHGAGDEALKLFANTLRARLRKSDIIGRFGGDELCIIFPETSLEDALVATESVRTSVAVTPVSVGGSDICYITGSFGLASLQEDRIDAATLMSRADEALYRAKASGRNRTCSVITNPSLFCPVSAQVVAATA